MESLSDLVYCSLKEEENNTVGWSKATIEYVVNHRSKVYTSIRGIAKSQGKMLPLADVEDIYSALIDYLYKTDDYNLEKAYSENNIVSFEGYIYSCIKFCVIRYVTRMYKEEKTRIGESLTDDEGKEMSIFDTIPDNRCSTSYNDFGYDLETICKMYESERYAFGTDIFMIWFIRLQTMVKNKQDRFKDILSVLGVSKKEISEVEQKTLLDGAMLSIAKAVSLMDINDAIKVIQNYTYSYRKIKEVIEIF